MAELDPKYDKMVDEAFKNSPSTSDPQHYLDKIGILRRRAGLGHVSAALN